MLSSQGKKEEKKNYKQECKAHKTGDPMLYSLYVHGSWMPWIEATRAAGKLKEGMSNLSYNLFLNPIGKATVYYGKMKFLYKGEVDQDGKA